LEIYNYLGPKKAFWELGWPGLFFQGRPWCGVYLEMAERAAYPDGGAFAQVVARGRLRDDVAPPFTYAGEGERPWIVEYRRDGQALGIEVDLMEWRLKRRWTGGPSTSSGSENAGAEPVEASHGPSTGSGCELGWPMLESPVARQNATGRVEIGNPSTGSGHAILECGQGPAWLFASPATGRYIAGYHGQQPAPLTLTVPGGRVEIAGMGVGTVVWDNGRVAVEAVGVRGEPAITRS
jgi:hypothetical protein